MEQNEQLSLSWDAHQKSICNGLSQLQQRGEFVDMTLAADGHHVKVHQMVMSLVSPYIKELISTTKSPHPIIFLNNISYTTLCAILEYIYTGEVLVPTFRLKDIIAAGKALHIRGLREMDVEKTADPDPITKTYPIPPKSTSISERLRQLKEKKNLEPLPPSEERPKEDKNIVSPPPMCKIYLDENSEWSAADINDTSMDTHDDDTEAGETTLDTSGTQTLNSSNNEKSNRSKVINRNLTADDKRNALMSQKIHFTVSNQGGLQIIHNRYLYNLRYFGKKNRKRLWRCVDYSNPVLKCPANICTYENNQVSERSYTHNHGFHDNKILKKIQDGGIYSIFQEAESLADGKKKERRVPATADDSSN